MKRVLFFAVAVCTALSISAASADTVTTFGNLPLAPNEASAPITATVSNGLLGIDVAFDYAESQDGSWSSDYYALIVDPSGDTIGLGDGLGDGDIDYDAGIGTGIDGIQNDSTAAGSYGTTFDLSLIQGFVPTFGEDGVYTIQIIDGWAGGTDVEVLGNATVTFFTNPVPEPSSAVLLGLAALGLVKRRRK